MNDIPFLFDKTIINFNLINYDENIRNKIFVECGSILSGVRNIIYHLIPYINISYNINETELKNKFREIIGTSTGMIFKTLELPIFNHYRSNDIIIDPKNIFGEPEYTDIIYLAFFEFVEGTNFIGANVYKTNFNYIKSKSYEFLNTPKPFVILDLDKTLYLCDTDYEQNMKGFFISDFTIKDVLYCDNNSFEHNMMIRPGTREFLHRLSKIANVFALTAGDLNYARSAVHKANTINWSSSYDNTNCDYNATIDLLNVYSVRKYAHVAIHKKFEYVLPLSVLENEELPNIKKIAIDDNIDSWDVGERQHVINISPFSPVNNNMNDLLSIVTYLENNTI